MLKNTISTEHVKPGRRRRRIQYLLRKKNVNNIAKDNTKTATHFCLWGDIKE